MANLELSSSCWFSCCEVSRDFGKCTCWQRETKNGYLKIPFANLAGQTTHLYTFGNRWICKLVWVKSGFSHCSCQFSIGRHSIHGCKHVAEAAHRGGDFCNPKSVGKVQWLVEKKASLSSACLVSGFCMVLELEFAFDLEVIVLDC